MRSALALFHWLVVRRLRREWGRTLLLVLGVALGVSVFTAVRLASRSALGSFTSTIDAVTGRATLQVSAGGDGLDERGFAALRRVPGVAAAAPVVEVNALARAGSAPVGGTDVEMGERAGYDETLLVLGLDPFAERPFARFSESDSLLSGAALALLTQPGAVAITRTLAARHGLTPGDTLQVLASGVPRPLIVVGLLGGEELQQAMGGNVVIADLATVQEVFARQGRLDRVDLLVAERDRARVRAALLARLPAGVQVERPAARTQQVENLVRAFTLNLLALSFIAVFVSTFLIFNAVALAVVRQRGDIGVLRGLGLTRRGVALLHLGEGALLGTAGGALGAVFGALFASAALAQVGRTISVLYLTGEVTRLRLEPASLLAGFGIGLGSALVSSLAPALEAAATPPAAAMREGARLEARRIPHGRIALAGLATLGLAAVAAALTLAWRAPAGGFVAAFLVLAGMSLLAPRFTLLAEAWATPLARRAGIEAALGTRSVRETVARASVVIAAVMVAVGMLVALTIMVGSFRRTVDTWITQSLRGDLYVEPVGHRASGAGTALPPAFVRGLTQLPGVLAVDTYRATRLTYGGRIAQLVGIEFAVQRDHGRLQFVGGEDPRRVLDRALASGGAVVTESFAHHHRVRAGERLALPTPQGTRSVRVEGVFYDYSTDAGAVLVDRALYAALAGEDRTESVAVYLAKGADLARTRAAIVTLAGPRTLLHVTPNQALRRRVLAVFDQTFRITWALQGIAVTVSVLGVMSALTALVLQRRRELAVLRAAGATGAQIRRLVLAESALLGLAGSLLGCVAGFVLSLLLVHVINREFFGWSLRMTVDPWVFVQAVVLMTASAVLAGTVPARLAAGRATAAALRIE